MKQSNSPTRTFLSLFAFAAIGCSPLVSSQPGVPPIEMTIEQFNQGRPANFYYLADVSEGYEAVCAKVLEALNEPYPGEPYVEYKERYSKYLLRSRLSVPWVEVPNYSESNDRNDWDIRYARFDFNNDDVDDDVLISINNLSSRPVHRVVVSKQESLLNSFLEFKDTQRRLLIESGAFAKGQEVRNKVREALIESYAEYEISNPERLSISEPFFDAALIEAHYYLLYTNANPIVRTRDVVVFDVHSNFTISPACRFVSKYAVLR